jgi:hypothetical protein
MTLIEGAGMPIRVAKDEYYAWLARASCAAVGCLSLAILLSIDVDRYAAAARDAKSVADFRAALDRLEAAERVLAEAVERANRVADLCGEPRIDARQVLRRFADENYLRHE